LLDFLGTGPAAFRFYTVGDNFFFVMFFSIAFMLIFALPFVAISKKFFKIEKYYTDDANIYY
jgi:hypothetical protein